LLEEPYNLEDALLVGGFVNTLLRRSDRVGLACLAQLVNVIAPLATNAEKTIRHTIYYPYAWALQYAHGRVLDLQVESETYPIKGEGLRADFARDEQVPFLDVVATHNPQNGQLAIFMLNRDTTRERDVTIASQSPTPSKVLACQTMTGSDLKARNTFEQPNHVAPRSLDAPQPGSSMTFRLPAGSYTVAHLATAG
jgi:alpha-N-arabinofuranosidase